jgi:hypothetical protein
MTAFHLGQRLVATDNAQGLDRGQEYIVRDITVQPVGMFGDVVTYDVEPIGGVRLLRIGNGHLLLKPAV